MLSLFKGPNKTRHGDGYYIPASPTFRSRACWLALARALVLTYVPKRNKAVLVSEEDWSAIQETLYLLSVPGMRESIREGMDTPVEECDEELDW